MATPLFEGALFENNSRLIFGLVPSIGVDGGIIYEQWIVKNVEAAIMT
jgi:hypothetical protein